MMKKRTAQDECEYDRQLREQEDIKTEVILELREQNRVLMMNQEKLLVSLINAEAALAVYRGNILRATMLANSNDSHHYCVTGCTRHDWDIVKGWSRKP